MPSLDYIDWVNQKVVERLPVDKIRVGAKYMMRCPICGDSRKSKLKKRGVYYLRNASYYCFNCGVALSGMEFLARLSGSGLDEIRHEYVRMKYNGKDNFSPNLSSVQKLGQAEIRPAINEKMKMPLSDKAKAYLAKRLVANAPFLKEKLYSCYTKSGAEFILIPWMVNGIEGYYQLNDFQRLDKAGRKYIFPSGKDKLVYGLDNIDVSFPYVICFEGVYDSLFVKNGVAIGGKTLTQLQRMIISKRYPRHEIVMALDNDVPGLIASARMLAKDGDCKFFKWFSDDTPDKDVNDYVLRKGDVNIFKDRAAVEACVIGPLAMKLFLVRRHLWRKSEFNGSKGEQTGKQRQVPQRGRAVLSAEPQ